MVILAGSHNAAISDSKVLDALDNLILPRAGGKHDVLAGFLLPSFHFLLYVSRPTKDAGAVYLDSEIHPTHMRLLS